MSDMSLSLEVQTPRLVLRQWLAADRRPFAALNGDPQVTEYLLPLTAQESDALADRLAAGIDEHGWGFWAVEAPGVAPFIGFVGLKPLAPALPFAPGVEIGWRLAQPYWGRGYASEAAHAALRVGFEQIGLDEIVAFTVPGNQRSRAVMERLGMRADPDLFDHPAVPEGSPLRAHVLYRMSRDGWLGQGNGDRGRENSPFAAA
jgi:RimJ/RimL family protein N-acetyltransferase